MRGDLSRDSFGRFDGTPVEKSVSNVPAVFSESIRASVRQRAATCAFMIAPFLVPGR